MNLINMYGPTVTLNELLSIFKMSRSEYYSSTNEDNPGYKEGFPKRLQGFKRIKFLTSAVEAYLLAISEDSEVIATK